MKRTLILIGIGLQFATAFAQQQNLSLKNKIDSLLGIDQLVQQNLIKANLQNASQTEIDSLEVIKTNTFNRHISTLKNIIKKYGLPTYSLVGQQSADNFMVMVNHSFSDIAFQQKIIRLAKKEVKNNNVSGNQLALLTDKMLIKSGKQQIYGTQCDYDKNGNAIAKNLVDPENVDQRRKEVGLKSLKEYLDFMTDLHQQMNKKSN